MARATSIVKGVETPLRYLKGVGPQRSNLLSRLGLETVADALLFAPRRYEDRKHLTSFRDLRVGDFQATTGTVAGISPPPPRSGRLPFQVLLRDETGGFLNAVFFNQPYLVSTFKRGQQVVLYGKVARFRRGPLQMVHPEFELVEEDDEERLHTGRLVPIYPLTEGLGQRRLRSLMHQVVDEFADAAPDPLPVSLRERLGLRLLAEALRTIHFPEDLPHAEAARRRLAFDDFFIFQLGLALRRRREAGAAGTPMGPPGPLVTRLRELLPYRLTRAQERVWAEIQEDLASGRPMNRLLQGDVGSGKTVVALLTVLTAVEAGFQAALMAPTEILAEQHSLTLGPLLAQLGVPLGLLTAGLKPSEREGLHAQIGAGEIRVVVGTHALIQEGVEFSRLGLAVVDEQHRFGVLQRATLRGKGTNPHVLVMTATPIPRTLALTAYGDLDLSVIDEMPPGRKPIVTAWRAESKRAQMYDFLRKELDAGRQAYVVCPLVEESEATDLRAATELAERLRQEVFSEVRVGLLHGRLRFDEKESVMRAFKAGEIQILVSTTVIEVGIDVPNASVMLVEHAERFGLAQLHQLRGRVGRGPWKSYCILMAGGGLTADAKRRLEAICESQDGFHIADVDLSLRGPGEFFGTRQSGLPEFKIGDLLRDGPLLEEARREAMTLMTADPSLAKPEHRLLREALVARWKGRLDLASIG